MAPPEIDAYLLCATPRSGSTLLCGLLDSSGVAGHPASYFNEKTLDRYAADWRVPRPPDGRIDAAFVQAARAAGRTPNGVFGGRVMAESLPALVAGLAAEGPDATAGDLDLLTAQLGRLRFVHLRRLDVVGQAVSWARSEQTHFWHAGEDVVPGGRAPEYDEEQVGRLVDRIAALERRWETWFAAQGVVPHEVTYESLAADPVSTARGVLDHLGLRPDRPLVVGHRRQADALNADWVRRYTSR